MQEGRRVREDFPMFNSLTNLEFSSIDGQYQYQAETKRQRTAYTRHQALELEKVGILFVVTRAFMVIIMLMIIRDDASDILMILIMLTSMIM
jgi:hypothetical protein